MMALQSLYTSISIVFLILLIAALASCFASGDKAQEKRFETLSVAEMSRWLKGDKPFVLVDSRSRNAYEASHIEGAINLPMGKFDELFMTLPKDKVIVLICYYGLFSRVAAQKLIKNGYSEVFSAAGGMRAWHKEAQIDFSSR